MIIKTSKLKNTHILRMPLGYAMAISILAIGVAVSPGLTSPASARSEPENGSHEQTTTIPSPTPVVATPPADGSGSNSGGSGGGNGSGSKTTSKSTSSSSTNDQSKVELEHRLAEQKQQAEQHAAEAESKAEDIRSKIAGQPEKKLDDNKLKICQKRESGIGVIMGRIGNRAQVQFDLYSSASTRVQAFVSNKKLTVSSYDQLLADIAAKKATAEVAIAKVKADKASFTCDGTNPTGTLDVFKADGEAQNQALKAYRTSVKSLLAAIKAAVQPPVATPAPVTNPNPGTGASQ